MKWRTILPQPSKFSSCSNTRVSPLRLPRLQSEKSSKLFRFHQRNRIIQKWQTKDFWFSKKGLQDRNGWMPHLTNIFAFIILIKTNPRGDWRSTVRGWIGNRPNIFCPKWIWPLSMFFGVDAVIQYKALITRQIIIGARFPQTRADPHMIFSLAVLSSSTKLFF